MLRLPIVSRGCTALLAFVALVACGDGGVRVVNEHTGAQAIITGAVPDGYRRVCESSACGPAAASTGSECIHPLGLRFADVCVEASADSSECVWLYVPCATWAPDLDAAVATTDAGWSGGDGGASFDASSGTDAGTSLDGGSSGDASVDGGSGDAGVDDAGAGITVQDGCAQSDCAGAAPAAPICFDGTLARVVCARSTAGSCGYLLVCGAS